MTKGHTAHTSSPTLVKNFRPAAGLGGRIFRCGHTDRLAQLFNNDSHNDVTLSSDLGRDTPEYFLLHRVGMILDLRSSGERKDSDAEKWMSRAPGGPLNVQEYNQDDLSLNGEITSNMDQERNVYRIDILSSQRLYEYISLNWLSSSKQNDLLWSNYILAADKLQQLHIDVLNQRGLTGLYEAILATSQKELCFALKKITQYLEMSPQKQSSNICNAGTVAVHCVHGKDRTGILIMLLQSVLGLNDEEIIKDYHLSHRLPSNKSRSRKQLNNNSSVTEESTSKQRFERNKLPQWTSYNLDHETFLSAPEQVMRYTMAYVREKYGSVSPGYLDHIGFASNWRRRLVESIIYKQNISLQKVSNL